MYQYKKYNWNTPETPAPAKDTQVTICVTENGKEIHHHGNMTSTGEFYIPFIALFPLTDPRVLAWKLYEPNEIKG